MKRKTNTKTNTKSKNEQKCALCSDNNTEISMSCTGMHSYCFSCIKRWTTSKKELTCPECRKSCDNFIKIFVPKEKYSKEFEEFLESVKIIPNPNKHDRDCKCFVDYFDNTCIYPDWSLIHYIENKNQLELYRENRENTKYKDNPSKLIKIINWNIHDHGHGRVHAHAHAHAHAHGELEHEHGEHGEQVE